MIYLVRKNSANTCSVIPHYLYSILGLQFTTSIFFVSTFILFSIFYLEVPFILSLVFDFGPSRLSHNLYQKTNRPTLYLISSRSGQSRRRQRPDTELHGLRRPRGLGCDLSNTYTEPKVFQFPMEFLGSGTWESFLVLPSVLRLNTN